MCLKWVLMLSASSIMDLLRGWNGDGPIEIDAMCSLPVIMAAVFYSPLDGAKGPQQGKKRDTRDMWNQTASQNILL